MLKLARTGHVSDTRGPAKERKTAKSPLRVTLRVGNEYEGKMFDYVHDADTLSTLLVEQQATKAARKKYRFVEIGSQGYLTRSGAEQEGRDISHKKARV